ncbi:MAG TPA: radical SAM family heme chaperone HemW, partial [Firmicutes bacterium]|nr:radical SAM family heme chaperone HemW [Bacillota bacterium]
MNVMRAERIQQPWLAWDLSRLRRDVGLYVHVPFCLARCRYCDFLTYGRDRPAGLEPDSYADLLAREINIRGEWFAQAYGPAGRGVGSIFIGGGTPTFLEAERLCRLVQQLRSSFRVDDAAEVTVEANPETISPRYIAALHDAGVNRLSIGVQALQDRHLAFLTRTHRSATVHRALEAAAAGPIGRISCDVIYGLPGMTAADLRQTIRALFSYSPEHVSAYELTIEPCTPLADWARRFPRQVASQDQVAEQQRAVQRLLASRGLYRYEVSNYARPGRECRHNLRYWLGGDYIGLGLGASSRIESAVVANPAEVGAYGKAVDHIGGGEDRLDAAFGELDAAGTSQAPPADGFLAARTRRGFSDDGQPVRP